MCIGTLGLVSCLGTRGSLNTKCTLWFFDLPCLVNISLNLFIKFFRNLAESVDGNESSLIDVGLVWVVWTAKEL